MSEQLCVFCKHCEIDHSGAHGMYAEAASFECAKGHWTGIKDYGEMTNYRAVIVQAKDCADYRPPIECVCPYCGTKYVGYSCPLCANSK